MALAKQLLFPWQCCQVLRWRRKQQIESHVISYHHMNDVLCHHVMSIGGTYLRYPPLPFKCVSYQQSQHLDTAPVCATSSHGHLLGHLSVFHGVMEVCLSSRIHEIMNQGPTRELAKQNQSVINDLGCSWQGFPIVGGKQLGSKLEKTL